MARSNRVQSSVHAIVQVAGVTALLSMQPVLASAEDGGLDTAIYNSIDADGSGSQAEQIPQASAPKITLIPSSKSDPACGSGKRATVVKYSDGEKVGETEKKCIPARQSN